VDSRSLSPGTVVMKRADDDDDSIAWFQFLQLNSRRKYSEEDGRCSCVIITLCCLLLRLVAVEVIVVNAKELWRQNIPVVQYLRNFIMVEQQLIRKLSLQSNIYYPCTLLHYYYWRCTERVWWLVICGGNWCLLGA
jgi:hypothetical protein